MLLLAIDPGSKESGFVVWDGSRILHKGKMENPVIAAIVRGNGAECDTQLCIEKITLYQKVNDDIFDTIIWSGRFIQVWTEWNKAAPDPILITRTDIKSALLPGVPPKQRNDSAIRMALIDKLGAPGTKKDPGPTYGCSKDIWAALALAVVAWERIHVSS